MKYYTDSTGTEYSNYDFEEFDTSDVDDYEARYSYLHDNLIERMFREKLSMSVQAMHALIKQQMGE